MENMTRRQALRRVGLLGAGLGLGMATGCTPLKILFHAYPRRFDEDEPLVDRTLAAFAEAILPGTDRDSLELARPLSDERFELASYRNYLAADLADRSRRLYGTGAFEKLGLAERERVVSEALDADGTTCKLYSGAIFLTQIAYFAGIYDDDGGCPLIDFDGRYRLRPLDELTYPDPDTYLTQAAMRSARYG